MSYVHRCVLLTLLAVSAIGRSDAQAAASSAASSTVVSAAPPAMPGHTMQNSNETKLFKEIHTLPPSDFHFGPNSCFQGNLHFPATNAVEVVKSLGSIGDFSLTAIPPDKIAIYWKATPPPPSALLQALKDNMDLASSAFTRVASVRVPSGSAEKSISQLTIPEDGSIVIKAVGTNCVLVMSKSAADEVTLAALTKKISQFYWQQPSAPPTQRLFYVDATAVAAKLSTSSKDASASDKSATSSSKGTSSADSPKADSPSSPTVSVNVTSGGTPATAKASSGDGGDSSGSSDQSEANKTDKTASATKDASKPTEGDKSKPAPASSPKPPNMQPVNDMLVYSNDDGSDRGIFERHRLMAILDLPRPEVLMNIWSLQASSGNYKVVNSEAENARELIAHHNDLLQQAIDKGWDSLSREMKSPTFFNELFYRYVTQKFARTDFKTKAVVVQKVGEKNPDEGTESSEVNKLEGMININRPKWGWCPVDQYCLGFTHAFEPFRPTFTNLLIGIVAAKDANGVAERTVAAMQGTNTPPPKVCNDEPYEGQDKCADQDTVKNFRSCMQDIDKQLHTFKEQAANSCQLADRIYMSEQIIAGQEENLQLKCFQAQAKRSFGPDTAVSSLYATTRAGLLRAAIADFLFNYKWATQYPHNFVPYDLTQSAQELNAEFNPLVLSFNQDVAAFTQNLEAELECKHKVDANQGNWFKASDRTFINDGMLSVRGISGVESLVDTVTQSFFDATNPPSLTDLVKSVSDAEKNVPGVLKSNLSANEAAVLLGALNSVQPAHAKIGRELKLDIIPHSLAGASSAELEVKLTAEETSDPTRFTADKSAEDTLSRVAKHDVSTRVRVESLKLFEVSAFSAMLQRPRSKFPILPPFFEVPYFGSFIGWPLPGAKVYHRSTAIVSAVIVPTATDLAFGIDFSADRVCDEDGCHPATSPEDFPSLLGFSKDSSSKDLLLREFRTLAVRNFHKVMVQCFASDGKSEYTGLLAPGKNPPLITEPCQHVVLYTDPDKLQEQLTAPVPPTN